MQQHEDQAQPLERSATLPALIDRHRALEDRLRALEHKIALTSAEQLELRRLKKEKLWVKDQIAQIAQTA